MLFVLHSLGNLFSWSFFLFEIGVKLQLLLNHLLFAQVAVMDGIVMGGGAGISLPGMFRVVTDRTV